MVELTWTNKIGERPEFTLKNISGKTINNISSNVYYYDKAGKVLKVGALERIPGLTGGFKMAAGESKTKEFGSLKAEVPAGTAAIEADAWAVQFDTGVFGKDQYWENLDLSPATNRPKGGVK